MSANASVLLVSSSAGFLRHARMALGPKVVTRTVEDAAPVSAAMKGEFDVVLVHGPALGSDPAESFARIRAAGAPVGVAADVPDLYHMLELSRHDIRAYFNSYMADVHYRQMVELLRDGLTWFSPPMMSGALALARDSIDQARESSNAVLAPLTNREREIATDVAAGLSNKEIAEERRITERTVKAHLTRIFKKLGTRNRHALAVKLREH